MWPRNPSQNEVGPAGASLPSFARRPREGTHGECRDRINAQGSEDIAKEESVSGKDVPAFYSTAACPVEAVFFAFRLKAPGRFFRGCATEG
jgi:hypothetical protein